MEGAKGQRVSQAPTRPVRCRCFICLQRIEPSVLLHVLIQTGVANWVKNLLKV